MKIGQLAQHAGVGIDTIRYYEREGLLPKAVRLPSGYRSYDVDAARRLRFVRRAKLLGFSLPEIRELLALTADGNGGDMGVLRASAAAKLADVEARLAELARVRDGLAALVAACPGHGALDDCPILGALAGDET